jgi:signal transduction histidine kinase
MTDAAPNLNSNLRLALQADGPTSRHPLEIHHLAHDLRGPLNSILGFSDLLLQGIEGPLNEIQTEDIAAIYQSAQKLLTLINTLVDLSKLQADRVSLEFAVVDVAELLATILAYDFGTNKSSDLSLALQPAPGQVYLWADRERLAQIVLGVLRYIFSQKRSGEVRLTAENEGSSVRLRISAAGLFLPPGQLAQLFELGVAIDATGRSELGPGGLELPLVRALAERLGGQVGVESNPNQGIIFTLQFPSAANVAAGDEP